MLASFLTAAILVWLGQYLVLRAKALRSAKKVFPWLFVLKTAASTSVDTTDQGGMTQTRDHHPIVYRCWSGSRLPG